MDECKLFRVQYDILYKALQTSKPDVMSLAVQLYSREVISQSVREEVNEASTPRDAASRLLRATEKRIESHPRDLRTFVERLATFPPWEENAKDMMAKLQDMDSKLVQPQPASEEPLSSYSPLTQQQLNIRVFISPTGALTTNPVPEQRVVSTASTREAFHLDHAPLHRRHPVKRGSEPSLQAGKVFQQASSPQSMTAQDLGSERQSSNEAALPEEVTDHSNQSTPTLFSSQTSSLSSQFSSCSDEDVLSMKGSFEDCLEKYRNMKRKLRWKDKKLRDERKKYDTGMAAANAANKDLEEQMKSLQLEKCHMTEELEAARKTVFASNFQKQQLVDQLQDRSLALKRYQDLCVVLEAQVKEAREGINFYDKYQKAEERTQELETTLEHYKQLVTEHEEKIAHLDMQIEILVSSTSITSSISDDLDLDLDPDDACTLDSW